MSVFAGGADLGTAHGQIVITANTKGVQEAAAALAGLQKQSATVTTSKLGSLANVTNKQLDSIAKKAAIVGVAISAGLGLAVNAASDLNESMNKSDVVFGNSAREIHEWSKTSAEAMGISRQAAEEAVSTFGNLFEGTGASQEKAAEMSKTVVQLASDLASFNNADPSDVLLNLRSGLVGEAEALRKYGINITQAAAQQEAMAVTGKKNADSLTQQDLILGRLSLVMKQTTNAQGDFNRTSKAFANSVRIMKAEMVNAEAEIGQALLPAAIALVHGISALVGAFNSIPAPIKNTVVITIAAAGAIALLTAGVAKAIVTVRQIGTAYTAMSGGLARLRGTATVATESNFTFAASNQAVATSATEAGVATEAAAAGFATEGAAAAAAAPEVAALGVAEAGAAAGTAEMGVAAAGSAGGISAAAGAMGGLAASLGPVALGLVALKLAWDDVDAIAHGGTPGFVKYAEDAGIKIGHGLAWVAGEVGAKGLEKSLNDNMDERALGNAIQNKLKKAGFSLDTDFGTLGGMDVKIKDLGITVGQLNEQQKASGLTMDDYIKKLQEQKKAADEANEAAKKGITVEELHAQQLQANVDAALEQKAAQDELNQAIQSQVNAQFIADQAAKGRALPDFLKNADDVQKATEEWDAGLQKLTTSALLNQGAIIDLSDELPGLQAGFTDADASAAKMISTMNKAGAIKLDAANAEAVKLSLALQTVDEHIATVEAGIQNNQEDMSMWAGRIDLVTSVLGGNVDVLQELEKELQNGTITQEQFNAAIDQGALGAFTKLDALYNAGKISQEQYNAAKAAGLDLIKRSAGGMEDENAELVQNLIDLDAYVQEHDNADGAVNKLSKSQRGFIAAMGDSRTQTFLQTLQLLLFMQAAGDVPKEVVTKFIADSGQANPIIQGVIDDLGLASGEHKVYLTADNANTVLDDLNNKVKFFVSADGTKVTIIADTKADALDAAKANVNALDGREVNVQINGSDGQIQTTLQDLENTKVTVPVELTLAQQNATVTGFGMPLSNSQGFEGPQIPPQVVEVTVADKTGPGVAAAKTSIGTIPPAAQAAGSQASTALGTGFAATAGETLQPGITALAGSLSDSTAGLMTQANSDGAIVGDAYVAGFVAALNDKNGLIYNAAFNVAYSAYVGAKAALGIQSPSKRAQEIAENFGGTFGDHLASLGPQAAKGASQFVDTALSPFDQTNLPVMRALAGDQGASPLSFTAPVGGPGAGRSVTLSITNNINGVTDPNAVGDIVVNRLVNVLDRLDAGGATA